MINLLLVLSSLAFAQDVEWSETEKEAAETEEPGDDGQKADASIRRLFIGPRSGRRVLYRNSPATALIERFRPLS